MPEVRALKVKDPKIRQPAYPLRSLPANTLHIGPSGSGKSVALIRTLIDRDKLGGCFDAYHVFSPGVWVDSQYKVLGKYIQEHTGQRLEECFHDTWDPGAIAQIIEDMKKVNNYLKKQVDDILERKERLKNELQVTTAELKKFSQNNENQLPLPA